MREVSEGNSGDYTAPDIRIRGSLNQLTQGGSVAGNLDHDYPVGTPSTYGGGLFSPVS